MIGRQFRVADAVAVYQQAGRIVKAVPRPGIVSGDREVWRTAGPSAPA